MKKILVLDDNQDILDIVVEVLAYERYYVKGIKSALSLLPVAESFHPDLILLDLRLSDGHGGELCKKIKADPALCHIPVIIFTSYHSPYDDLSKYCCDGVIDKPFDLVHLIDTINNFLVNADGMLDEG
ncbi:response regulator [Mucilaginibacter auburnensis]|uniref:Response regulator receiver domain-containing protein n=1 Tax=Mucilaginibacter auburnensis TaxID=1457233 RepID=A0A2H9VS69_9SPHI|nr:response regulator [Mucilaginibacter auburnensis]PJJ83642.1 response regulator receiver domain-containing protein [Mucilaginibacter auburnensis]